MANAWLSSNCIIPLCSGIDIIHFSFAIDKVSHRILDNNYNFKSLTVHNFRGHCYDKIQLICFFNDKPAHSYLCFLLKTYCPLVLIISTFKNVVLHEIMSAVLKLKVRQIIRQFERFLHIMPVESNMIFLTLEDLLCLESF